MREAENLPRYLVVCPASPLALYLVVPVGSPLPRRASRAKHHPFHNPEESMCTYVRGSMKMDPNQGDVSTSVFIYSQSDKFRFSLSLVSAIESADG